MSTRVKKRTSKLLSFALAFALVLAGTGTFAGLSGILAPAMKARAEGTELNHAVTAGTVYRIGSHDYVATATANSGDVMFIAKEPTTQTYTFDELDEVFVQGAGGALDVTPASNVVSDLDTAGLIPALSMSEWGYYVYPDSGKSYLQGFFGVPTKEDVEAAPGFSVTPAAWTTSKNGGYSSEQAYYVSGRNLMSDWVSNSKKALIAFRLNLSAEGVYVYTKDGTNYITYAVPVDEEHFPDANFRNWVLSQDYGSDGVLTQSEIAGATEINVSNKEIADLTGIEYFTALIELDCGNNQLTSLDVSHNTALEYLYCNSNQLTGLDVSDNTSLKALWCYENQLTTLDVSHDTALTELKCYSNQLTSLDVSGCTALKWLHCYNNQLTSLDVSDCTALETLLCNSNQLTGLDASNNPALALLDCSNNQFTSLKLDFAYAGYGGTAGGKATISNGGYGTFTVARSGSSFLIEPKNNTILLNNPTADGYTFTGWEVTGDATQTKGNGKTTFTIGSGDATITATWEETGIAINETTFPDANFRNRVLSQSYGADGKLTPSEIAGVAEIDVSNQEIADLTGIEYFTALKTLKCYNNSLTSLDVSHNTALTELNCSAASLTSLDVSGCTALTELNCSGNQLTSLDLSNNTALTSLDCGINQLTSLDVSNNTALQQLACGINQLTSLDVSNNTALTELNCYDNQLTALKVKFGSPGNLATISNGGFGTIKVNDYSFTNKKISLDDPTADGCTFTGWETTGDVTKEEETGTTSFTFGTGDATITATWEQLCTVEYVDGQGNTLQSTTVTEGSATPAYSGTPTREGYTFTGWTPTVADTVTADVTYMATWKQLFTVKYVNGLGTTLLEETVAEGSATPTYTGAPTREGYTFTGWSPTVASTVTADATYTATWEQNATPMHTVTIKSQFLDTDSHLLEETQRTVDYEEGETVTIEAPTVDGYFIVGQTSVTLTVDNDSTVVFVYQQNPATDPTDPTDPEEKPYSVTVALPFKMRWQGISGENITKTLGNVKIEYTSKQYGRFAGVALLVVDTSRLPDGKQIKVSIPNRNTTINVGGVDLTASVVSFEDAILDNSGSCQLRIDLVTDRSDLLYDDFFGKPISGGINLSVEELT